MSIKKRSIFGTLAAAAAVAGVAFSLTVAAEPASAVAASGPAIEEVTTEVPTWEEFRATATQNEDGSFVVDGDIRIADEAKLKMWFEAASAGHSGGSIKHDDHHEHGEHTDLALHNDYYGNPIYWDRASVGNLTYCVSNNFGSSKQAVINAMAAAERPWESASSAIDFRYVPSQDANCNNRNNNVVFSVEPSNSYDYDAMAFFPNDPKSERIVYVTPRMFGQQVPAQNVAAHELGHVLGFRHEHIRLGRPGCTEPGPWTNLTEYDSASVMHYPHCGGTGNMSFTALDRQGTQAVYGY